MQNTLDEIIRMESAVLHIRLFGSFDLRLGEHRLTLDSSRVESLLAYLLLHREAPQPRQKLAFLLWPDSSEAQAHTNLRHVLHNLRRSFPDHDRFLDIAPRALQWRAEALFWLDVAAFEEALSRAEKVEGDTRLSALQRAIELYRGDLVEASYDEWLSEERDRLRQRFLEALERLVALCEDRRDYAGAIQYAERLLRHDPLREETYSQLMRLHDARGDRARAIRVYHSCVAALEDELGVEPSAATRAAYEALLPVEQKVEALAPGVEPISGSPIVGRVGEKTRLLDLWRSSERGRPQLVLVTGEPGIGKTRLVEDLRSWCAHRGILTAEARSYAAEGALAYAPIVMWLRSEPLKRRVRRLDRAHLTELARLLPEILTEIPDLARPEPLPERDQRQRLFDAVTRAILTAGAATDTPPLLLVADDLHWWDQESLQLLHYLLRIAPEARLLVAATARSEDVGPKHPLNDLRAGLQTIGSFAEIELRRLSRQDTAILAEHVVGRPLGEMDAERLYRETEGNPLFVVETLRAGWTSGQSPTSPRVQTVIESRLAQLSEPARNLVGLAAAIGRAFPTDVLAQAGTADEATLVRSLDELWRRRIIRDQGTDAYDFSHDKIREVAYLALSPAQRRYHHLRVAQALEQIYVHDQEAVSGLIAAHYESAGLAGQAITWYERAAEAALQLHANRDAIRLLDRALHVLHTLPTSAQRDARELGILTAFPAPLGAAEGMASRRLAEIQRRAGQLAGSLGVELAPPLFRGLALASLSHYDFDVARQAGEQLRARGRRDGDDVLLVEAEYVLGIVAFWGGELDAARQHFEEAVERYRPEHRRAHLLRYAQDPKAVCLSRLGNTLWFLGRPESATRARAAASALAEEIGHPYTRTIVQLFGALLALEMHDLERLRAYARAMDETEAELHANLFQNPGEVFHGYLDVLDGRPDAGLARIRRPLEDMRQAPAAPGSYAFGMRIFLEACSAAGNCRTGFEATEQVLKHGGVRLWEAEFRRLRAEFLIALGAPVEDVTPELERALQIARQQGAKMLELRAAMSLLRHRLTCGSEQEVSEARSSLAAIAAAIPEGRNVPELREAATLLTPPESLATPHT